MDEIKKSARYPHVPSRMKAMFTAFNTGKTVQLANVLYDHARDDVYKDGPAFGKQSALKLSLDGIKDEYVVPELLSGMSDDMVNALICNDIAFKYESDNNFRESILQVGENPCCYVTTIVFADKKGLFLNSKQALKVCDRMQAYIQGGMLRGPPSAICTAIDRAYHSVAYTLKNPWCMYTPQLVKFRNMLEGRAKAFPNSEEFSRQAPLHIGYTDNGIRRLDEYQLTPNLSTKTTKCYALLASICYTLEYKMKSIRIPILPLLNSPQRKIGEIMLCRLARSMYDEGGLDLKPPGPTQKDLTDKQYHNAKKLAIVDTNYSEKGLERLDKNIGEHRKIIDVLLEVRNSNLDRKPQYIEDNERILEEKQSSVMEEYSRAHNALEAGKRICTQNIMTLQEEMEYMEVEKPFIDELFMSVFSQNPN